MENEEEKIIKQAFEKIDDFYDVTSPNHMTLTVLLKDKKEEYKKNLRKELITFIFVAVASVLLVALLIMKVPIVYFIIQVLSIGIAIIYTYFGRKNHIKEGQNL
ncbi:YxlC family protein [Heyndrickxia oleronia]|uniref:YxlC family protein n=1 Tax=Heyndrickxia oleronia TaxID=38875 RepID=A0AAW6SQJ0_9BACI|nr:YxlC family protein [Heyndrickxia oleronia]MDH5159512.1 YxlC family protein [Heyndrickxia oleronia]